MNADYPLYGFAIYPLVRGKVVPKPLDHLCAVTMGATLAVPTLFGYVNAKVDKVSLKDRTARAVSRRMGCSLRFEEGYWTSHCSFDMDAKVTVQIIDEP